MSLSSFRSDNAYQDRAENPSYLSVVFLALCQGEFSFEYFSFIDIFFLTGSYGMMMMLMLVKTRRKITTLCWACPVYQGLCYMLYVD